MELEFTKQIDSGTPTFVKGNDGLLTIVYGSGERGRWLSQYNIPVTPGDIFTISGKRRVSDNGVAGVTVVFWKADVVGNEYHSSVELEPLTQPGEALEEYSNTFTVPEDVDGLRVDLRAWTGSGSCEWLDTSLNTPDIEPPDPDPPPDDDNKTEVHGFISGRYIVIETTSLPTLGPGQVPVEWPKYPVSGVMWEDNIYLKIEKES